MEEFGRTLHIVAFSVKGRMTKDIVASVLTHITEKIGMSPVHHPVMYQYPADGKGGTGFTRIQPITESFLAFDAWPDLGGGYLIICSCKSFSPADVIGVIRSNGLKVIELEENTMRLPK